MRSRKRPPRSARWIAWTVPLLLLAASCGGGSNGVNVIVEDRDGSGDASDAAGPSDTPGPVEVIDAGGACPAGVDPCVPCQNDETCKGAFGDIGECEVGTCGPDGYCVRSALEAGTPCGEPDACHVVGMCEVVDGAPACVTGAEIDCDDRDPCTTDTCDAADGCVYGPSGAPGCCEVDADCDDADVCDGDETCDAAGACVDGTALDCDDGNPCTVDTCDAADGCDNTLAPGPGCCEVDADCDDGNPCTSATCADDGQCVATNRIGACDDGDPCTSGDRCVDGACLPTQAQAACGLLCELTGAAGETVECPIHLMRSADAGPNAVALALQVDWEDGGATLTTLVDRVCLGASACADVLIPASTSSLFHGGHAVYLAPELPPDWHGAVGISILHLVNPETPITTAFVEEGDGVYAPRGETRVVTLRFVLDRDVPADAPMAILASAVAAEDGSGRALATAVTHLGIVTAADGCGGGLTLCFDAWACTTDACDAGTRSCSFPPDDAACDDDNPCTLDDRCAAGRCVAGAFADEGTACLGDDLCTERGACDGAGACAYDASEAIVCPAPPDDCGAYVCDTATGDCGLTPVAPGTGCDDGDACSGPDLCDSAGVCVGRVVRCDDGLACTADSCDDGDGCVHSTDDSLCDDDNDCTVDVCDPTAGCVHSSNDGVDCDDADPCTSDDACLGGECQGTWDIAACGCTTDADCAGLDDGNPCNGEYACVGEVCTIDPTTVIRCADQTPGDCMTRACDPATGGCVDRFVDEGTTCDPANILCFDDAVCDDSGACVGASVDCEDGDLCTFDHCDGLLGCLHEDIPECEPIYDICLIHGSAGQEVICPLLLARANDTLTPPSGADFDIAWDSGRVDFLGLRDEVCIGPICAPNNIPSCATGETNCNWGNLYPSGHILLAVPRDVAGWEEQGKLLLFHPSDPFRALTEAVMGPDNSLVAAEAQYLAARFSIVQDIPEGNPVAVQLSSVSFSIATGQSYRARLIETNAGRAIVVFALR